MNEEQKPDGQPHYAGCLSSWGFREDPFGESYPYQDFFWARPREKLEFIEFLLEDAKTSRKAVNVLIRGDYGSGKTYMLHTLQAYVQKKLQGLGLLFQIPSKSSVRGFRDILSQIVGQADVDKIAEIARKISTEKGFKEYGDLQNFLVTELENRDVVTAICNLAFGREYALTSTWLSGEATWFQVRALGLSNSPRDEKMALSIILDLLNFLGFEYPIIGIFIDELENLVGESGPIRSIREGLRNFYDGIVYKKQRGSIVIFTAATARILFEIEAALGAALIDRLDQEVVLGPLDEDATKDFIRTVFDWARKDVKLKGKLSPPFKDENAIAQFIKLLPTTNVVVPSSRISGEMGTPRRMLKIGKYLLQQACFKGIKSLDVDSVKTILLEKE